MNPPSSPAERVAPDVADLVSGPRIALGATLGLWVGDAILLGLTRAGATWAQWAEGMGSAALVAASTALVLGGLVGPVVAPLLRQLAERAQAERTKVRAGDKEARHEFLALTLMVPFLFALWAAGIYRGAIAIVFRLARPDTIAGAITLFVVVFTGFLLVVFPSAVRLARGFIDRLSTMRGTPWIVQRAWPIPTFLALAVFYVAAKIVFAQRELVAALPWLEATPLIGLVFGLAFAIYLPRAPFWFRRATLALTIFVLAFACASGVRMRREWNSAQKIGFNRALSGRVGYAAWTRVLDFDRDGQLNVLGGGDCAPFDARRYTGAPDPPGDGIDQDCDGVDSPHVSLDARPPLALDSGALPARPTVILVTVDALAAPELSGAPRAFRPRPDATPR